MLARIANYFPYLMHHYHNFHRNAGLYTMQCFSSKDLEHLQTLTDIINRPLKYYGTLFSLVAELENVFI